MNAEKNLRTEARWLKHCVTCATTLLAIAVIVMLLGLLARGVRAIWHLGWNLPDQF